MPSVIWQIQSFFLSTVFISYWPFTSKFESFSHFSVLWDFMYYLFFIYGLFKQLCVCVLGACLYL